MYSCRGCASYRERGVRGPRARAGSTVHAGPWIHAKAHAAPGPCAEGARRQARKASAQANCAGVNFGEGSTELAEGCDQAPRAATPTHPPTPLPPRHPHRRARPAICGTRRPRAPCDAPTPPGLAQSHGGARSRRDSRCAQLAACKLAACWINCAARHGVGRFGEPMGGKNEMGNRVGREPRGDRRSPDLRLAAEATGGPITHLVRPGRERELG